MLDKQSVHGDRCERTCCVVDMFRLSWREENTVDSGLVWVKRLSRGLISSLKVVPVHAKLHFDILQAWNNFGDWTSPHRILSNRREMVVRKSVTVFS